MIEALSQKCKVYDPWLVMGESEKPSTVLDDFLSQSTIDMSHLNEGRVELRRPDIDESSAIAFGKSKIQARYKQINEKRRLFSAI